MTRIPVPIYDATVPVACTIGREDIPARVELLERLRSALTAIDRTEHGLLLHLAPDAAAEADARRFAVDEKACCQFWGFEVTSAGGELTLRWDGPPSSDQLLDLFLGYFRGEQPISAITDLL